MLTRNYYNIFLVSLNGYTQAEKARSTTNVLKSIYHSSNTYSKLFEQFRATSVATSTNSYGVAFGTGNTAPTIDDYWLSGDLITTMKIVATQSAVDFTNIKHVWTITVQNTGTESVTIREIAIIASVAHSNTANYSAMLDRIVLDTPLTLDAGTQGTITYTFDLAIYQ